MKKTLSQLIGEKVVVKSRIKTCNLLVGEFRESATKHRKRLLVKLEELNKQIKSFHTNKS